MFNIYVASSWKNVYQPHVVRFLRELGHDVYDFKNVCGQKGFSWAEVDENWRDWSPAEFVAGLNHPAAQSGFAHDFDALQKADVCVLVLPCGRSAHTEAGWAKGAGKKVIVYVPEAQEAELMYKLFDGVCCSEQELQTRLAELERP